jgi:hypothetical protein
VQKALGWITTKKWMNALQSAVDHNDERLKGVREIRKCLAAVSTVEKQFLAGVVAVMCHFRHFDLGNSTIHLACLVAKRFDRSAMLRTFSLSV